MNDITEIHIKNGRFAYDAKINPGETAMAQEAKEFAILILDRVGGGAPAVALTSRKPKRAKVDADSYPEVITETEEESL